MNAKPIPQEQVFLTQKAGKLYELKNDKSGDKAPPLEDLESTLLLRRRQELNEVQSQLEEKRSRFRKCMADCRQKRLDLQNKKRQLRERVQKFETFLSENEAKRQRAISKALSERKIREQKEQEFMNLQEVLRNETSKSERIVLSIAAHKPFEQYLSWILATLPPGYVDSQEPHINDILQRHQTLSETRSDLQAALNSRLDDIEKETNRLNDLMKLKNDKVLVCNSHLGVLQKRLDKAKTDCARVEAFVGEAVQTGKSRVLYF